MKIIKKTMLKYTDKDLYFIDQITCDVNEGVYDGYDFNPSVALSCSEYSESLKSIIYSILKVEKHYSAKNAISRISCIFKTCPQYAERIIRGIEGVRLNTSFGQDSITIK